MMKRLGPILLMLVTVFIGFGLIIPVLPVMVRNTSNNSLQLGLMLAVYSAVSFFISPWWGRVSDRIGRKPVLILGVLGFAVSFFIFGMSSGLLWLMYVSRVIGGAFSGAVTATAMAYIADVTGVEDRTKGMALAGMSIGMGFVIGPGLGGLLSTFGIAIPFFAASALAVLNAVWALVSLKESNQHGARGRDTSQKQSRWAAFAGALKYLYIVDFVAQFSIAALEGVFQYFEMDRIHVTPGEVGAMFFISGIVGALIQGGLVRRYVTHGREVPTMYLGLVVSGIGMFAILASSNFWSAAIFMTLFGAGNTVIKPTLTSVITKQTQVGQGLASGLLSSMDSLARVIGPLLATFLYEFHEALPFIVTGIIVLVSVGLVYAFTVHSRTDRLAPDAS